MAKITLATSAAVDVSAKAATKAATKAPTPAKCEAVRAAAFENRSAWNGLLGAVKAAGGLQDALRTFVIEGDYMRAMGLANDDEGRAKAAHQLWNCVGHETKAPPKEGQGRRNAKQEAAYASARQVWSRLLKKAAVTPKGKGAGNNNAAKKGQGATTDAAETVAPIVAAPDKPVAPVAVTPDAAREFMAQQAAMLLAYANKNAKVMPIELRNAVAAFVTATKPPQEAAAPAPAKA